MNNILVSIVIPAYKATFLKYSIESALNQTYKNIEVIVVNDNSPEPLDEIVHSFNDKRLKYYVNQQNIGGKDPVANWNHCLSLGSGEYFALLCDDDLYEPTFIEQMLVLAEKYPDCKVFRGRGRFIDTNGHTIDYYPACPEWETAINYLIDLEGGRRFQTISEFLYRKQHIVKLGGYSSLPIAWCADHQSVVKFGEESGIASSSEFLVSFRSSSINLSAPNEKHVREKVYAENLYTQWINKFSNAYDEEKRSILLAHRRKHERQEMIFYLTYANGKDIVYLWKHRNTEEYHISTHCFFSAISRKIINKMRSLYKRIII